MTEAVSNGGDPHQPSGVAIRKAWMGARYLGTEWYGVRDEAIQLMELAYHRVADRRDENYGVWKKAVLDAEALVRQWFQAVGIEAPPFQEDALFGRVAPLLSSAKPEEHIELIQALLTDYGPRFAEQFHYRHEHEGNVHLCLTGPTGMAKSSCAISIADWFHAMEAARVLAHVNFDLADLPAKLETKRARETVIQDEFLAQSGEGAVTTQKLFENLEDTLRQSQVNLFVCSPRRQEHVTMQATLEAIGWNPREHWTAFLCWIDQRPKGLVAVPWCRAELWEPYSTFKKRNVQRSISGAFRDVTYIARTGMRLYEREFIVDHLLNSVGKKKRKSDFEEAIELYAGDMMSEQQRRRVASFMFNAARNYHKLERDFERRFQVKPNDGLRLVSESMRRRADDEEAA